MRLQLWVPNNTLVSAQTFNSLFTMHALTMIFLAIMPLSCVLQFHHSAADWRPRCGVPTLERLQLLGVHPGRDHAQYQLPAGWRA
jgi:hypothetical protein